MLMRQNKRCTQCVDDMCVVFSMYIPSNHFSIGTSDSTLYQIISANHSRHVMPSGNSLKRKLRGDLHKTTMCQILKKNAVITQNFRIEAKHLCRTALPAALPEVSALVEELSLPHPACPDTPEYQPVLRVQNSLTVTFLRWGAQVNQMLQKQFHKTRTMSLWSMPAHLLVLASFCEGHLLP